VKIIILSVLAVAMIGLMIPSVFGEEIQIEIKSHKNNYLYDEKPKFEIFLNKQIPNTKLYGYIVPANNKNFDIDLPSCEQNMLDSESWRLKQYRIPNYNAIWGFNHEHLNPDGTVRSCGFILNDGKPLDIKESLQMHLVIEPKKSGKLIHIKSDGTKSERTEESYMLIVWYGDSSEPFAIKKSESFVWDRITIREKTQFIRDNYLPTKFDIGTNWQIPILESIDDFAHHPNPNISAGIDLKRWVGDQYFLRNPSQNPDYGMEMGITIGYFDYENPSYKNPELEVYSKDFRCMDGVSGAEYEYLRTICEGKNFEIILDSETDQCRPHTGCVDQNPREQHELFLKTITDKISSNPIPSHSLSDKQPEQESINEQEPVTEPEPEPIPTPSQESSDGGGCLIATAAFGSEMAPQVQFLRELRDNTVLQTQSGTTFMTGFNQFYYSFSPAVADLERENPVFKEAVKLTLTPLLTSLTLLNYVDIDTESEMLGYGIGVILLNIGMYFIAPAVLIKRIFLQSK